MAEIVCSIGKANLDEIICSGKLHNREDFSPEELRLFKIRTGSKIRKKVICDTHARKYLWSYENNQKQCCDPFVRHGEKVVKKGIDYSISLEGRDKGKELDPPLDLIPGKKLCVTCKIKLFKLWKDNNIELPAEIQSSPSKSGTTSQSSSTVSSQQQDEKQQQEQPKLQSSPDYVKPPSQSCITDLNNWLLENGESVIDFSKLLNQKTYIVQQLDKVHRILGNCAGVSDNSSSVSEWLRKSILYDELIHQLQDFFVNTKSKADIIHSLSVLPKSLSVEAIKSDFPASIRLIRKVKSLTEEKGILCTPNKKPGRPLEEDTIKMVTSFYLRQDVSKEQAGKNQVISVKESDGKRVKKRKRLILGNLKDLHAEFEKEFPEYKISFPKFAQIRPKECVLASASGMHNVCVCTHHENPKLMFDGAHLKSFTLYNQATDCMKTVMCTPSTDDCYLRICPKCPDNAVLREKLLYHFDEEMIENVTFNQWESADRANIMTLTCSVEDFVERFILQLEDLIPHHFIYKTQADYFRKQQASLNEGEVIVVGDFAENYTFKVQDSIQSFYFGSKQATIHPFSCYMKDISKDLVMQYSCAIISDCMDHSTATFYAFQKKLIEHLKTVARDSQSIPIQEIKKIIYFSDGCGGQYKNRKMAANICYHKKDFGIEAEWNFFATSHGKSACDGLGGTIKRLASDFSLKNTTPGSQITTPLRLYEWCQTHIEGIITLWVSKEEVVKEAEFLSVRFEAALPIDGIKSCHRIIPSGENFVILKRYSAALTGEKKQISRAEEGIHWENIRGFVTFWDKEEPKWYLGSVQEKDEDTGTLTIQKLNFRSGKKYEFVFTDEEGTLCKQDNILTLPQTSMILKGTVVRILAAESKTADAVLKKKLVLRLS